MKKFSYKKLLAYALSAALFTMQLPMSASADAGTGSDTDALAFEKEEPDEELPEELDELDSLSLEGIFEKQKDYVPEEILLTVRGGLEALYELNTEKQLEFMEDFDFSLINTFEAAGDEEEEEESDEASLMEEGEENTGADIFLVTCPDTESKAALRKIVKKFEALQGVESVSLNEVYSVESVEEDDFTCEQWGFLPADENGVPSEAAHMGLGDTAAAERGEEAAVNWNCYAENGGTKDFSTPSPLVNTEGIVVAVLDTGIDTEHPDLKNALWAEGENYPELAEFGGGKYGYNAVRANSFGQEYSSDDVTDDCHHGTHVSGIIAAEWNGFGVSGVTSGAKILTVKAGNNRGQFSAADVMKGFNYIIAAKKAGVNIAVLNNSWGGSYTSAPYDRYMHEFAKLGIIVCFASGNDGENVDLNEDTTSYYSALPNLINVASHDANGRLSDFSNYGAREVHVSAPGGNIYSTVPRDMSVLNLAVSSAEAVQDENGQKYEDRFSDKDSTFFQYTAVTDTDFEITEKGGLRNSGALKVTLRKQGFNAIGVSYDLSSLAEDELPESFGFAFKLEAPEEAKGYIYAFTYSVNGEKKNSAIRSGYLNKSWNTASFALPEGIDRTGEIRINVAYAKDSKTTLDSGTYILDNIMFTNDAVPYDYGSGTSMAAPAVAGEAALLFSAFHPDYAFSDDQAALAADVAARIEGSVEFMPDTSDRQKLISGGYVRADKALHGETVPVLSSAELWDADGTEIAVIKGRFIDGVTLEGKQAEEPTVSIDGIEANVLEYTGTSVTVDAGSCLGAEGLSGEHEFRVTSVYGTGRKFMEMKYPAALFTRLPVSTREEMPELYNLQFRSLQAVNDTMYLLLYNLNNGYEIVKQEIGSTDGLWQKTSCDAEYVLRSNLSAYDRKLIFAEFPGNSERQIVLQVYDPGSDAAVAYNTGLNGKKVNDMKLCYSGKNLLLMLTYTDKSCRIYMLDPETKQASEDYWSCTSNKSKAVVTYDENGVFYITDRASTWVLTYTPGGDPEYNVVEYDLNYPEDKASGQSGNLAGAGVKNGILLTGIVSVNTAGTITHDTYLLNRNSPEAAAKPTEKLVSESLITGHVAAAYKGKYYVLGRTEYADDFVVYACADAETFEAPGDAAAAEDEKQEDSGDNSGGNANADSGSGGSSGKDTEASSGGSSIGGMNGEAVLPGFVLTNYGWNRSADGSWSFADEDGKKIRNAWAAIAGKTYDAKAAGYSWFRFDESGKMLTGWFTDPKDGAVYYLNPVSNGKLGEMLTGWQFIDGSWYYFRTQQGGPMGSLDIEKSIPDFSKDLQEG